MLYKLLIYLLTPMIHHVYKRNGVTVTLLSVGVDLLFWTLLSVGGGVFW